MTVGQKKKAGASNDDTKPQGSPGRRHVMKRPDSQARDSMGNAREGLLGRLLAEIVIRRN